MNTGKLFAAAAVTAMLVTSLGGQAWAKEKASLALVEPVAQYKVYVATNLDKLVADTKALTDAIKAGDVEKAKALFAPTRMSYEHIEPIASLFSDLDAAIDARADAYEKVEKDPAFRGFHRIEYALWVQNTTKDLGPVASKLLADVQTLRKKIGSLPLPPAKVVGGAAGLMEEIAATKISGEEDRYSHTDLWDIRANVDGSHKIYELVRPLIAKQDDAFVTKVDANFAAVDQTLAKYQQGDAFQTYDKLSGADRKVLAAAVNALAEDLSTLRGKLGLN